MSEIYLLYVGKDKGTIPDVPARNLTYEEAKQLDVIHLIQSGLYKYAFEEAIPDEYKADLKLSEKAPEEKKATRRHSRRKE